MDATRTEQIKSSEEIIRDLINQLLAKPESDEELEIELFGYPADFLDDPREVRRRSLSEYVQIEKRYGKTVSFEVMRTFNGQIEPGPIYASKAPLFLVELAGERTYISGPKLRSLIERNADKGTVISDVRGERFVVKIRTRLLLDNCDIG